MKSILLSAIVLTVSVSAFAKIKTPTLEQKIVEISCQTSSNSEVQQMCEELKQVEMGKIKKVEAESYLHSIYKPKIQQNSEIKQLGGLRSIEVDCGLPYDNTMSCRINASAGGDRTGVLHLIYAVRVTFDASGALSHYELTEDKIRID